MEDLALEYVNNIKNTKEFQRLIELKNIINKKYSLLIISFKTAEAEYIEAKERPEIFNLDEKKYAFIEAKTKLYSKEEVKEYFILESKINEELENDMNTLKESISNKFKTYHSMKL